MYSEVLQICLLLYLAMNTTLSLSVMACSIFVIGTLHCLGTMLGQ